MSDPLRTFLQDPGHAFLREALARLRPPGPIIGLYLAEKSPSRSWPRDEFGTSANKRHGLTDDCPVNSDDHCGVLSLSPHFIVGQIPDNPNR